MEFLIFLHPRKHGFSHQAAAALLFFLRIPAFIHGKDLHFLFFHLFMLFILHGQPYAIHFFKQYRNLLFSL